MTTSLWHRRRVERLAQLLDEAGGGRRQRVRSPHDEQLSDLVAIRNRLAETPPPPVDPEFRAGLRAMLLAAAEREGIGTNDLAEPAEPRQARRPARGPRTRTAVITGVTVGAVAFAGMSTASATAVPGDALYGVKRSTERAQLALAGSDVGRAELYLGFARTRLAEAGTVSDGLDRVLDDMDRDTTAGVSLLTTAATNRHDPTALDPIGPFVAHQREALTDLVHEATGSERERVEESLDLLDNVTQRAGDLRQHLAYGCQSAASIVDALGPNPETCVSLPAPGALDPIAPDAPALQQAQPGNGGPRHSDGGRTGPAGSIGPSGSSGSSGWSGSNGSNGDDQAATSGSESTDPAPPTSEQGQPATTGEPAKDGDGNGVMDGLNRLLGDLLGG